MVPTAPAPSSISVVFMFRFPTVPSGPPVAGDIFRVVSTPSQALGEDAGIKNFYTDDGLTNGLEYTYAVTSYDTGNPKTGLIAMESSQIETMVRVVPRGPSLPGIEQLRLRI